MVTLNLRFALRQLAKAPGFTAVAVLSLALGIAGTTVLFGVLDALLLELPAGVRAPDEVARIFIVRQVGGIRTPDGGPGSYLDFEALRAGTHGVEAVAAFLPARDYDFGLGSEAQRLRGRPVSGSFFPLLGVHPALGRVLLPDDDGPTGAQNVVVLSDRAWRFRFGSDPDVVGRSLHLDGATFTVVGVVGPEFTGINPEPIDLWTPLGTAAGELFDRAGVALFEYVARIAPEADRQQVKTSAELNLATMASNHPDLDPSPGVILGRLNATSGPGLSGSARLALGLWVATGMLLLIACANVANLLLARASSRRQELAVRRALGAGELQIARQLLTESVLLALLGGLVGLALAMAAGVLVRRIPEVASAKWIDPRLIGFALFASCVTGLLFGLAPILQRTRIRPFAALGSSQSGGPPARGRLMAVLVTGQVALAVVLLVGAGLFVRSLQKVVTIDTGMDLSRLALAGVDLDSAGYDAAESAAFHERALERLRALPGVEGASLVMPLPLSGQGWGVFVGDGPAGEYVDVYEGPYSYIVGDDYFRTMGIPILRGRGFTAEDRDGSGPVAVVSERLARALVADGNAVGMCVALSPGAAASDCARIVGVAGDVRHRFLVDEPMPYLYRPVAQLPFHEGPSMFEPSFLVRAVGDSPLPLGSIQTALQGLASDLPYVEVQPFEARVGAAAVRPFRIAAQLLGVFGSLALLLAAAGLYGTLSHVVVSRIREVGVRMALGAGRGEITWLVMRRALTPVVVGLALGLAAASAITRLIDAQLHGLTSRDPLSLATVLLALLGVAGLAAWLPARRAATVDPMATLRTE